MRDFLSVNIVEKKAVEVFRDLYEGSQGTILMIGEECLSPQTQTMGTLS